MYRKFLTVPPIASMMERLSKATTEQAAVWAVYPWLWPEEVAPVEMAEAVADEGEL